MHWHKLIPTPYMTFSFFIFVGSAIKLMRKDGWVLGCVAALLMMTFYLVSQYWHVSHSIALHMPLVDVFAALILFGSALSLERFIFRIRLAEFFGDISYPLYLIHVPPAWICEWLLARQGFSVQSIVAIVFTGSVALAWLLHRCVELPAYALGRRLAAASAIHISNLLSNDAPQF